MSDFGKLLLLFLFLLVEVAGRESNWHNGHPPPAVTPYIQLPSISPTHKDKFRVMTLPGSLRTHPLIIPFSPTSPRAELSDELLERSSAGVDSYMIPSEEESESGNDSFLIRVG